MAAALELTQSSGAEMLFLEVLAGNEPAIALYQSLGFEDLEAPAMQLPFSSWLATPKAAVA